jgi:hypothetical protein
LARKAPICRGRSIWRRCGAFLAFALAIGLAPGIGEGRSLDPSVDCAADAQRVEFSGLVFCWPVAPDAPEFKFENLDQMVGSQLFVESRRATEDDVRALSTSGNAGKSHALAVFSIASFDNPVLSAFEMPARLERIREAIDLREDELGMIAIEVDEGERFGMQTFEFLQMTSTLFAASKTLLSKGSPPELVEYWVAMTSDGKADYVMGCRILDRTRNCSSQFTLSANLVRVGISMSETADSARLAFEAVRNQIRSYVVSPELAP